MLIIVFGSGVLFFTSVVGSTTRRGMSHYPIVLSGLVIGLKVGIHSIGILFYHIVDVLYVLLFRYCGMLGYIICVTFISLLGRRYGVNLSCNHALECYLVSSVCVPESLPDICLKRD